MTAIIIITAMSFILICQKLDIKIKKPGTRG